MIGLGRRKVERFSLKLLTYFYKDYEELKSKPLELVTSNICSGGAYFKTEKPLSVETDVKLYIIFPVDKFNNVKGEISYIEVSGSIIRTDQQGMAVCFDKDYKISPHLQE